MLRRRSLNMKKVEMQVSEYRDAIKCYFNGIVLDPLYFMQGIIIGILLAILFIYLKECRIL
jgi:hypothetical protein